jgi:hypothetical protein
MSRRIRRAAGATECQIVPLNGHFSANDSSAVPARDLVPPCTVEASLCSGLGEQVQVRLDTAGKDLQLEVALCVDGHDPGDLRVGIVVANDRVPPDDRLEPAANVDGSNPQTHVVGHVHEVVDAEDDPRSRTSLR